MGCFEVLYSFLHDRTMSLRRVRGVYLALPKEFFE
jgi:hypothetical protein